MSDSGGHSGEASPGGSAGSPREFVAAAYDAWAAELYRYALMLLTDHAAAEDAVHQTFVKLAGMGPRVLGIGSCADYLRTAVRHECWRMIDKRRRGPRPVDLASSAPLLEAAGPGPVDACERAEVEAALRRLPTEQREVVYLKVYEGMTFQQIADVVGLSINTAASRYRYAMARLRKHFGNECDDEGDSDER